MSAVARLTIKLHTVQAARLDRGAPFRGVVGGRGCGKTWVGAYDMLRKAEPNALYMAVTPTYTMLKDACWRTFLELGNELRFIANVNRSDLRIVLGNGAEILFRSGDEADRLRGPSLAGAWLGEASVMDRSVFDVGIACLRHGGRMGWLSATFTPKGRQHWTEEIFGKGAEARPLRNGECGARSDARLSRNIQKVQRRRRPLPRRWRVGDEPARCPARHL